MIRISGIPRRIAAAAVLVALTAPFVGTVPSASGSAPAQSAPVEAVCPPATPGKAECLALRRTDVTARPASASPLLTPPSGYGPADLQSAYALPSGSNGSGLTVAIVDAYDLPTAEADLAVYRNQYGLPPCTTANLCFRKVDQGGGTSYPAPNVNWGEEIALDIDMVSAACPNCKILLVEANTNDPDNLGAAVNKAVSLGAVAVSNSYGGPEWSGEASYDTRYYNHPGVAITASTGDCGYNCSGQLPDNAYAAVEYPAASPYVIAVGGTTLISAANARGWTESAWGSIANGGGTGSGCSLYEPKPSWQHDTGCAKRTQADVSAVADPATYVAIYDSYGVGGWSGAGGTSAASPIIASTFALAGRPAAGINPASYLYANSAALNDVVGGNNLVTNQACTVTYLCNGVAGYDGPTGLGTPNGTGAFASLTVPGKPTNLVAGAGNAAVSLTWTAPGNGGGGITAYSVTETEHGLGVVACSITSAASCTVSGLTNGTEYTFTLHANNSVGPGPESDPSNKVTPVAPTVPGKPTGVTATVGVGSASVFWTAPADNGGSAVTGYTVTSTPDGQTCGTGGALSCTVSGLNAGQAYTFTVTAANAVGTGPASDPSNSAAQPAAPGKPTGVTAAGSLGSALVSWTAPSDNGSAITGYIVTSAPDAKICVTSGELSCMVSGLSNGQMYTFTVHATNGVGAGPESDPSTEILVFTGATFHAIAPGRVLDSRSGLGAGLFHSRTKQSFQVTGLWGVPAGAVAVTGNVTVVGQNAAGYVTIAPSLSSGTQPLTSTLNFPAGDTRANGVTVALGAGGKLDAMYWSANSASTTQVLFDVTGYFANDASGATFHAIAPGRVLDSRSSVGAGLFHARTKQSFAVTGLWGVPAGAVAVTGNVTITGQKRAGYVTVAPSLTSGSQPQTSTINFPLGDTRANGVTVSLGAAGKLDAMYWSSSTSDTVNIIFDVTGYFASDTTGATFHAITPGRVLDSRSGTGAGLFHSRTKQSFALTGLWGVPAGAVAVTGNVTITGQTAASYVTIAPSLTSGVQPSTSTINFPAGDTRANGVTVSLGADGKLDAMYWTANAANTTQVLFDVTGYFS